MSGQRVQVVVRLGNHYLFGNGPKERGLLFEFVQDAQALTDLGGVDIGRNHQDRRTTAPGFLQRRNRKSRAWAGGRDNDP